MKTTFVGRQINVPEDFKPIAETKLARYDKYFKDDASATVKLSKQRGHERVEITITSAGMIYRGEESEATFRSALDLALESIERQIRKNKTRLEKRLRDGALSDFYAEPEPAPDDDELVIRRKSFPLTPMTPEEAILQMNLLGHDFFVFQNGDSGETNVVYKRNGGDYGLIEPTLK
ncbi:MAG: ribosome-associated translation inhibitor RaiA [Clostridia bacterium]|nr:ribosome-associated translation inhibitor RaiA [Clostridia bacterium]